MNYSGLLVACKPGCFSQALEAVSAISGAEVHQKQEEASRFIVVVEAPSVTEETEIFKSISALDSVMDVSLLVHHFEESAEINPIDNFEKLTQ